MKKLALILLAGWSVPAAASGLEIRACPSQHARSYPLDTAHSATSLVLQNIALLNTGGQPVAVDRLDIELLREGVALDRRTLASEDLARAAASTGSLISSGMTKLVAFQFCDGALLGDSLPASGATLQPGQAILLSQQVFAWRGKRDSVRISASGASLTLPIDAGTSPPIRWPLSGGPWYVAGASFHTTHRWAVPEQFALDIVKLGADGRSHRGTGAALTDFHAYGADILATAGGRVVKVIRAASEDPPLLRKPGETMEAYFGRIGEAQAVRLAAGEAAVMGETLIIDHGDSVFAVYAHLKPGSAKVREGQTVAAGQRIAKLGNSGNSTEPHLHFQLCDRPSALNCSAVAPAFAGIDLPMADGPRPLQSGDVVVAP
jgi:murein DD-endopeptidase MepM/ murein hydrolase activator NlpD